MANTRKGVPAGWTWRDGRPRWIPSPALRALGWKGADLKDAAGRWLPRGASIDRAQAIAEAAAAWRRDGAPVPPALAAMAPAGAIGPAGGPAIRAPLTDPRSIGALVDAYLASREFQAIRNQIDRRSKLNRFIDVLAGWPVKPPRDADAAALARYAAARDVARGRSVFVLEPPAFDPTGGGATHEDALLYTVYWTLRERVGINMAHGVLSDVSAWLSWCVKRRRAIPRNWAELVDRATPPGRIRVGDWDELALLVEAAEAMGLPSIADAIILGVDLSWSQADRLPLRWAQISGDGRVKATRSKTGITGETPLLPTLGLRRIETIRARQREIFGPNVTPTHVILCESTRRPWTPDHYRHRFADVRAHGAALAASRAARAAADGDNQGAVHWGRLADSLPGLRDQDLRDTAVTVAFDAGLDAPQIASRTLHSLKRIMEVLGKHYAQIGQPIADAGALKLTVHLAALGVKL